MILKYIAEIYVDDEDLPTIASDIVDKQKSDWWGTDLDSLILDEAYELNYDSCYWDGDYDEFADKLEVLVKQEQELRNGNRN